MKSPFTFKSAYSKSKPVKKVGNIKPRSEKKPVDMQQRTIHELNSFSVLAEEDEVSNQTSNVEILNPIEDEVLDQTSKVEVLKSGGNDSFYSPIPLVQETIRVSKGSVPASPMQPSSAIHSPPTSASPQLPSKGDLLMHISVIDQECSRIFMEAVMVNDPIKAAALKQELTFLNNKRDLLISAVNFSSYSIPSQNIVSPIFAPQASSTKLPSNLFQYPIDTEVHDFMKSFETYAVAEMGVDTSNYVRLLLRTCQKCEFKSNFIMKELLLVHPPKSWNEAKAAFIHKFAKVDVQLDWQRDYASMRQLEGESIPQFTDRYLTLILKLGIQEDSLSNILHFKSIVLPPILMEYNRAKRLNSFFTSTNGVPLNSDVTSVQQGAPTETFEFLSFVFNQIHLDLIAAERQKSAIRVRKARPSDSLPIIVDQPKELSTMKSSESVCSFCLEKGHRAEGCFKNPAYICSSCHQSAPGHPVYRCPKRKI